MPKNKTKPKTKQNESNWNENKIRFIIEKYLNQISVIKRVRIFLQLI